MHIRQKIFTGYIALVAVSVVLVAVFLITLANVNGSYSDLVNRDQKVLLLANNLYSNAQRQVLTARSYDQLLESSLLNEFENSLLAQQRIITDIIPLLTQEDDVQAISSIQAASARYTATAQQGMELARAGEQGDLLTLTRTEIDPAALALLDECM